MITQYGMSERFGMVGLESPANQYLDGRNVLNCSDRTAAEIDQEVMRVIKEAYQEALRLLREHREALDRIADFLIEKETITGKEFMEIFHRVEQEAAERRAAGVTPIYDTPALEAPETDAVKTEAPETPEGKAQDLEATEQSAAADNTVISLSGPVAEDAPENTDI